MLFEMISGRPPINGDNHMHLLQNILKKAVRLPADVRVSKECVNLLRLLLNRSPFSRAGFKEFFEASNAFVALGCEGTFVHDEGTCQKPSELRTVPENQTALPTAAQVPPPQTQIPPQEEQMQSQQQQMMQQQQQIQSSAPVVVPQQPQSSLYPSYIPPHGRATLPSTAVARLSNNRTLEPLVPSPPMSSMSPIQAATNAASRDVRPSGPRYMSPLHAVEIVHTGRPRK